MTDKKTLLEIRKAMKKRKPLFRRKDSNKKKRIEGDVWRLARGCDNKHRLNRKGHTKVPSHGYRAPALVRGLHHTGLIPVNVSTPSQLTKMHKDTEGVVVSGRTGDRKRKLILIEAQKLGLKVLNLEATKAVEQIDAAMNARRHEKQKEEAHKATETKKQAPKKEEHKAHEANAQPHDYAHMSEDDKKKAEKAEKDKILHTKN
jgi:large subunit ribosomal protein L32e